MGWKCVLGAGAREKQVVRRWEDSGRWGWGVISWASPGLEGKEVPCGHWRRVDFSKGMTRELGANRNGEDQTRSLTLSL